MKADTVVLNARVYTGDVQRPDAQAVAIHAGVVIAVGADDDVRGLVDPNTEVIDAGGRLVIPGFNDAHVHFIMGAEELVGVDLRPSHDASDMARRLGEYASGRPAGEWITGGYWDHEAWPGAALPRRDQIDAATPRHPVFVKRLDGHLALANSEAMRRAGITGDVTPPAGGAVVTDAAGPTGILKDAAMDLVLRAIPPPALDDILTRARAALGHAAALGVTSVQDMTASPLELDAYDILRARRVDGADHVDAELRCRR